MSSRNVERALAHYDAYNRGRLDEAVAPYADGATCIEHARGLTLQGREQVRAWLGEFKAAFPDDTASDLRATDAGDAVVVQFVARGTNDGALGPFPATGRRFAVPVCEVLHFDENGAIVRQENYYDQLSLLVQLGHAHMPAG